MSNSNKIKSDLIWHRERYRGFRFEIWQTAATTGTPRKAFYSLRWNLAAYPQVKRRQDGYVSLTEAIQKTKAIINHRQGAVTRARQNVKYDPPWIGEAGLIERLPTGDGPYAFIPPDNTVPPSVIEALRYR